MRYLIIFSFLFTWLNSITHAQLVSDKVELLGAWFDSNVPFDGSNNHYNEVWGFTWKDSEYAVIGSRRGAYILDVTVAEYPFLVKFIPGGDSTVVNRDYHDHNGYLYMVADQGEHASLQIVDFTGLPDTIILAYDSDTLFNRVHNIFIDSSAERLYACSVKDTGFVADLGIYDISEPLNPKLLLAYDAEDVVHDIYVYNDTAFSNNSNQGLYIYDFTDLNNTKVIGSVTDYPERGYNHSGWATEDRQYYFFADETPGSDIKVCDISDINDVEVVATFNSGTVDTAMVHNLIVKGNFLYVSYYHDGFRLFNIEDPENPIQVGFYDTYLSDDYSGGKGAWGVYPFLPSGNVLVSDRERGLFILDVQQALIPIDTFPIDTVPNANIGIYPNPFTTDITFNLPGDDWVNKIYISDMQGRTVLELKPKSDETFTLQNLQYLSPGIYMAHIYGNDLRMVRKLVKSP